MSATSDLLKNAVPSGKSKLPVGKKMSASAALLKGASVPIGGLKYVPQKKEEPKEKKKSLGKKILSGVGSFAKTLASPVVTTVARPFQAVAELAGASSEQVDKFSAKIPFGLVAPVPQNFKDVKKDVGRAVQTAAFAIPGGGLANTIKGGAAFGAGASLEQGNDVFSKETLKGVAFGSATGALLHGAFKLGGKLSGKKVPVAKTPEPSLKYNPLQLPAPKAPKVPEPAPIALGGKQYKGELTIKKASKNATTVNPKTGRFQVSYSSSEGTPVANRIIEGDVRPAPLPQEYTARTGEAMPRMATGIPEARPVSPDIRLTKSTAGDKVSKAAKDINAKIVQEAFEALPDEELARFNTVSRAEQIQDITELLTTDRASLIDMARTGRVPKKYDPQILFNVAKKEADDLFRTTGDNSLQVELAGSPIASQGSILAQKFGAIGVLKDSTDAVSLLQQNDRSLAEAFKRKTGKDVNDVIASEVKTAMSKKPKVTLNDFINNLKEC